VVGVADLGVLASSQHQISLPVATVARVVTLDTPSWSLDREHLLALHQVARLTVLQFGRHWRFPVTPVSKESRSALNILLTTRIKHNDRLYTGTRTVSHSKVCNIQFHDQRKHSRHHLHLVQAAFLLRHVQVFVTFFHGDNVASLFRLTKLTLLRCDVFFKQRLNICMK
jgi:hypothetical protein